ncbi:DUF6923 family protein [Saccharopolyspora endophytica]|uniref:DUF6923 domain-containing protein n=1 Tax=Saccharopolyspora endophytica TaxID=543886 RepID=A0ABS5DPA4_9PSEU|nr:hypothetical protein [Saccharopolyspora endophytica]MBQ0928135.1 hypothetical protein [Saccharopolyspora endophytica]
MGARTSRAGLAGALALLAAVVAPAAEADPACEALQVRTRGSTSVLHRVVLPDFSDTRVGALPYRVNALGYSVAQGFAYGIASGFSDGGHVVVLRPSDPPLDLGPVVAGRADTRWNPLGHPTAGAIEGDRWYVLEDDHLHAVDLDPASPTFRHVLSSVQLDEHHGPFGVDDFDVGPDGLLYGVAQTYAGIPAVVRIDHRTGAVDPVVWLPGLLPDSYGSVVIGRDRALYVTANHSGGTYRIGSGGTLVKLGEVPTMSSSDAAGCLRRPPPTPPPTTTPPPPTTTRPTPPAPAPPTTAPPTTSAPTRPAQTVTPTPTRGPVPPEPVEEPSEPPETASPAPVSEDPDADESGHTTQEKRRWAVAALVLLIGGSAAVRALGRG